MKKEDAALIKQEEDNSVKTKTNIEKLRRDIFKISALSEVFSEAMFSVSKSGIIFNNEDLLNIANILSDYSYNAKETIEELYSVEVCRNFLQNSQN